MPLAQRIDSKLRLIAATLLAGFLAAGCTTPATQTASGLPLSNVPEEVALECRQLVEGWNAGDLNAFISIYAETATFTLADGFLVGRAAIREFYAPNFAPGAARDQLAFEQLDVEVLAPDAVLVRVIYRNTQGGQVTRRGTASLVLRRIFGQWRIIHDHSS